MTQIAVVSRPGVFTPGDPVLGLGRLRQPTGRGNIVPRSYAQIWPVGTSFTRARMEAIFDDIGLIRVANESQRLGHTSPGCDRGYNPRTDGFPSRRKPVLRLPIRCLGENLPRSAIPHQPCSAYPPTSQGKRRNRPHIHRCGYSLPAVNRTSPHPHSPVPFRRISQLCDPHHHCGGSTNLNQTQRVP